GAHPGGKSIDDLQVLQGSPAVLEDLLFYIDTLSRLLYNDINDLIRITGCHPNKDGLRLNHH
ncbi:MAG TPA: hypothetical protein VFY83_06790, partial [Anaerolineales bacterium]|nr:hypothetical protein [Anaerolineales bacterium]